MQLNNCDSQPCCAIICNTMNLVISRPLAKANYLHRVNMIDTVNTHANHTSFDCLVKSDKGAIHMQLTSCDRQPWARLFATRCTL